MQKYFIPPLASILLYITLSVMREAIINYDKFSSNGVLFSLYFILFMSAFGYPIALFFHMIGCVYIKILQKFNQYNLFILLPSGFLIGAFGSFVLGEYILDAFVIIGGLAGMMSSLLYFIFDKK